MSDALVPAALLLAAGMATAVVLTRDPTRQAIGLSAYGIVLGVLCVVLQAPDVALSQVAVGTVIVPLIVILAIRAITRRSPRGHAGGHAGGAAWGGPRADVPAERGDRPRGGDRG